MARHRRDPRREAVEREFDRLLSLSEPGEDLICVGADLNPATLLAAYARGMFPMGLGRHGSGQLGWWSPDPRGVLPLDELVVSRSLRQSLKRYEVRVDTAFSAVLGACAAPERPGRWITPAVIDAYTELHRQGFAHSVECFLDEELVGGLYGVSIGGLFAGESMFHHARDASKVALVALVDLLGADGRSRLLDVQWKTDHLASLGVITMPRVRYLHALADAVTLPPPNWTAGVLRRAGLNSSARRS